MATTTIALAGNPNSGKTTLFNALTGANQYVGNWPGVTVEKKAGKLKENKSVSIVDLPGIYSLSPYTLEELISRNYLIDEKPDAIINIIDGSNLERNLYLTMQLLEMGIPTVVAINMMDVVTKSGEVLDLENLSRSLGCKVVEISALKNQGIDKLRDAVLQVATGAEDTKKDYVDKTAAAATYFSSELNKAFDQIKEHLPQNTPAELRDFYVVKLFERDEKLATFLIEESSKAAMVAGQTTPKVIAEETVQQYAEQADQPIDRKHSHQTKDAEVVLTQLSTDHKTAKQLMAAAEPIIKNAETALDDDSESLIINERYSHIADIIAGSYKKRNPKTDSVSDRIDKVVTNRVLALPIFAVVMFLVYFISVTTVGTFVTDWANDGLFGDGWFLSGGGEAWEEVVANYETAQAQIEGFEHEAEHYNLDPASPTFTQDAARLDLVGTYESYDDETGTSEGAEVTLANYEAALEVQEPDPSEYGIWVPGVPVLVGDLLTAIGSAEWVDSLVLDGIVAGVGAVLGFVPQMLVLFLLLALLEQCGYMSRIAFILDRVFRRFGLSGKSFIPILVGTGCGVPGIMASRTIENQNDRRMTVMTTTFIPCGAKLPVIALFAGAIFGGAWWVAPSAYFLGIATILCSGIVLKKTRFFAGDAAPFLMELPAYHPPTVGMVARSTWERAWSFIKRAGTIILLACILIWFISSYGFTEEGFGAVEDQSQSILAVLGSGLAWIFAPLGFGNWQATSASITGLIAKENLVSTFAILYAGEGGWYSLFQGSMGLAAAYALLAFNLLCAPCFAAMGAIRREMNNARWFFAAIGYQCGVAWIVGLWVFQFAGLATGEVAFNVFTVVATVLAAGFFYLLLRPMKKSYQGQVAKRAVDAA
ncbi:MAG: ferrous iron transporter B [Coriobacteriales bacterium]|jgi:ferrous iron transport protein B|nr:ferrous iron transporter B [Coriobacteriales bacterium]